VVSLSKQSLSVDACCRDVGPVGLWTTDGSTEDGRCILSEDQDKDEDEDVMMRVRVSMKKSVHLVIASRHVIREYLGTYLGMMEDGVKLARIVLLTLPPASDWPTWKGVHEEDENKRLGNDQVQGRLGSQIPQIPT